MDLLDPGWPHPGRPLRGTAAARSGRDGRSLRSARPRARRRHRDQDTDACRTATRSRASSASSGRCNRPRTRTWSRSASWSATATCGSSRWSWSTGAHFLEHVRGDTSTKLRARAAPARGRAVRAARRRARPPRHQAVERDGHARGPRRAPRLRPRDERSIRARQSIADGPIGTVEYMAPEQATGRQVGEAADWYAVGVMLYEALTGQMPHTGHALEILVAEAAGRAAAGARARARRARAIWRRCACELLAIEPSARPTGDAIARRLGVDAPSARRHVDAGAARTRVRRPRARARRARRVGGARAHAAASCTSSSASRASASPSWSRDFTRSIARRRAGRAGPRRPLLRARVGAVQGVRRRRRRARAGARGDARALERSGPLRAAGDSVKSSHSLIVVCDVASPVPSTHTGCFGEVARALLGGEHDRAAAVAADAAVQLRERVGDHRASSARRRS